MWSFHCARVALLIQHQTRRRIVSAASLAPQYFPTFSHKWHDFRENVTEHKMFTLTLTTTCI